MKRTKLNVILVIIIGVGIIISTFVLHQEEILTANTNKIEYKILVDVEESKLYLFENNKAVKEYKCSGGKWNTPSPIGKWKITDKSKWGEGFRPVAGWDLMYHGENLEYMAP